MSTLRSPIPSTTRSSIAPATASTRFAAVRERDATAAENADAYAGGGRRIERVEVSLDAGKTWLLAECDYPEDLYRAVALSDPVYGRIDLTESDRNFCWMFWSYTVPVKRLGESSSIMVRAMDESLALQPADMCASDSALQAMLTMQTSTRPA